MVKTHARKIVMILLLFIIAVSFSACSSVNAMTLQDEYGSVYELVTVTLNQQEINGAGYNIDLLKSRIRLTSKDEAMRMVEEYKQRLTLNVSAQAFSFGGSVHDYDCGIHVVEKDWENDEYTVGLKFDSTDIYKSFYNISNDEAELITTEKHFLYDKIIRSTTTKYASHKELYNRLYAYYSVNYPKLIKSPDKKLLYTYISNTPRQHSNADYIAVQDFDYYHTWLIQDDLDREIVMYYNIANQGRCVLICIAIACGVCALLGSVAIINNIKNKLKLKNNKEILKN